MSSKKIFIFLLLAFLLCGNSYSQSRQVRKKIANAEKVEKKQKKAEEKERIKKIRAHKKIQTKETRKRMKETDKRAEKFNKRTDKTLFQRIFNQRKRKTKKKYG